MGARCSRWAWWSFEHAGNVVAKSRDPIIRFHGGEAGREILSLVDLEQYSTFAETVENWQVTSEGEMHFRAGLEWASTNADAGKAVLYPFVFSLSQKNIIQVTQNNLRILQDGDPIVRPSVSTTISNTQFLTNEVWTKIQVGTGIVTFNDRLEIRSNGTDESGVRQEVFIADADQETEHGLDIHVARGPVRIKIGLIEGDGNILNVVAKTGHHSLSFTPGAASVWLEITSTEFVDRIVTEVTIAPSGDIRLDTPWSTVEQIEQLSVKQDRDTVWMVHEQVKPQLLERRGVTSWSLVDYAPIDGPFESPNIDTSVLLKPSVKHGDGIVTANSEIFEPTHVGALLKMTHAGQYAIKVIGSANVFSDPILVEGVGGARKFFYKLSGVFVATVTMQVSTTKDGGWVNVFQESSNGDFDYTDGRDNERLYYRIGIRIDSEYTSGAVTAQLSSGSSSKDGIARITAVNSATEAEIETIRVFAEDAETFDWAFGAWNDYTGWPGAVEEFDGRIYLGAYDLLTGSKAADFFSHDVDDGSATDAIARNLRGGTIRWLRGISRLVAGTDEFEHTIQTTSFEEPLAPSNISIRKASNVGVAPVQSVIIDSRVIYADRSEVILNELLYSVEKQRYIPNDMCKGHRKVCRPGIKQIVVQRRPDTRVYIIREDGQCVVLLYEPDDGLKAWQRFVTDGNFESVCVLPGYIEDEVYFTISRQIGGATVRFTEKLGEFEPSSALVAKYADSFVFYDGEPTTIISVPHLVGREVVVWADGAYHHPRTVDEAGNITLERSASKVVAGLGYRAPWKSMRLLSQDGSGFLDLKRPFHATIVLRDSVPYLRFGRDFSEMGVIADRKQSDSYDSGAVLQSLQTPPLKIDGRHDVDPRLCLEAVAPYGPVIVQALVSTSQSNLKA
jgi:hypothetical protein